MDTVSLQYTLTIHTHSSQNTSQVKVNSITILVDLQIWWKHYWAPHSVTLSQSHSQLPTESSFLLQCHHPSQFHLLPIAITVAVTLTLTLILTFLNHSLLYSSSPAEPPSTA